MRYFFKTGISLANMKKCSRAMERYCHSKIFFLCFEFVVQLLLLKNKKSAISLELWLDCTFICICLLMIHMFEIQILCQRVSWNSSMWQYYLTMAQRANASSWRIPAKGGREGRISLCGSSLLFFFQSSSLPCLVAFCHFPKCEDLSS